MRKDMRAMLALAQAEATQRQLPLTSLGLGNNSTPPHDSGLDGKGLHAATRLVAWPKAAHPTP